MVAVRGYRELIELPDYFTIGNIIFGIHGMISARLGQYYFVIIFFFLSFVCDYIDGRIARIMRRKEKVFGEVLDSLADMTSFVLLPIVFGYCLGLTGPLCVLILITFAVSGALRLARFEAVKMEPGYFLGMPSPYNWLIFSATYIFVDWLNLGPDFRVIIFSGMFLLSAVLMSSPFKFKKY